MKEISLTRAGFARLITRLITLPITLAAVFTGPSVAQTGAPQSVYQRDAQLEARLRATLAAMPASYVPRTHHKTPDGTPLFINRLIQEASPYLLQHAHNPVDWHAWNADTMRKAEAGGKPVFLSIGYATCHWCHVMERESFENAEIAAYINEHFLPVKVDREQRPDIDRIYMTAVQLTGKGTGGWPLTSFLMPNGRPFYAGTYSPPDRFLQLLKASVRALDERAPEVQLYASDVSRAVNNYLDSVEEAAEFDQAAVNQAVRNLLAGYEPSSGGFSEAPKFPNEPVLDLLLHITRHPDTPQNHKAAVIEALNTTLSNMQSGGIHDQVAGGFHRYSTDKLWLVPHFEKMLYNQAQLAEIYTSMFELTGNKRFARTAKRTYDFVLANMTSPNGTFYSALDADNLNAEGETVEGEYYTWTKEQLAAALSKEDLERALSLFKVTPAGNFESETILTLPLEATPGDYAFVDAISDRLIKTRARKNPPLRDDKIIVAWNALMIKSLAKASHVFNSGRYRNAAVKAANSLLETNLNLKTGDLKRIQFIGKPAQRPGQLDDYAGMILALAALYDISGNGRWLDRAGTLAGEMVARFMDEETGAFYMVDPPLTAASSLIMRPIDTFDGAKPSGSSQALGALVTLYQRLGDPNLHKKSLEAWTRLSGNALKRPRSSATALLYGMQLQSTPSASLIYGGMGTVRVATKRTGDTVTVRMDVQKGWHINSNKPLQSDYIPTVLSSPDDTLTAVTYPAREIYRPGFSDEDLAVYSGQTSINATLKSGVEPVLHLQIQACSDEICLPPQKLPLTVSAKETWNSN